MNATNTELFDRLTALVRDAQEDRAKLLRALVGCDDSERAKHAHTLRRLHEIDSLGRGLLFWMEDDR